MRTILKLAVALCSIGIATGAMAENWPSKPIHWISPWSPGGGNDTLSRAIAGEISKTLGQTVIVENRPGATGVVGTDLVAKAPPDGYMVTLGAPGTHATAASIYPNLPYDQIKDFTPITLVGTVPNVLVVHPSVPAKTLAELTAYLKAHPGELNYSSVGNGSMQHLSGELYKQQAGVDIAHVPYKGSAPALVDLTAGRVQMAFESMPTVLPHVRSGALRAIAVTTPKRSSLMPDVPTMAESGLKGFEVTIWYAVFGPAGMPKEIVEKLNHAIVDAVKTPELGERLAALGADVAGSTAAELATYQREQAAKWSEFIKERKITRN